MKKFIIVLLSSILLGCSSNEQFQYNSPNFDLIKLTDGVYACINKVGGKAICNAGIIDNGKETIIFDSFLSPKVAEEMLNIVEKLGLSPIKFVINSHYHNDHIRGNQVFADDVDIISTAKTAELIKDREPLNIKDEKIYAPLRFAYFDSLKTAYTGDSTDREFMNIQLWRPYFEVLSESHKVVKTRLPNLFVKESKSLDGPNRKLQLITNGQGHTASDLVLYLPDDQILFTGDLVFNNYHPYLADGDPEELKNWLDYLNTLEIKTLVPGHGQKGGKELIPVMKTYILSLEGLATKMVETNKVIDDVEKVEIPELYKGWWFDLFFYLNLKFIFKQMDSEKEG
jgi:glyoxylase-like metal-dependent hydrolase (beta-lactamase superfamily II)